MLIWFVRVISILVLLLNYLPVNAAEDILDVYGSVSDPFATPAQKMVRKLMEEERQEKALIAYTLTIDTSDQIACENIKRSLSNDPQFNSNPNSEHLCDFDPKNPIVTVLQFREIDGVEYHRRLDTSRAFSFEENMGTHTRNTAIMMSAMMGFLIALPPETTKWNHTEDAQNIFEAYAQNIKNGPVKDNDNWFFNYVTHPWAGALYYGIARHQGLSKWKSFGYSVFMSTILWEYGFEAIKEAPSIQDLLITPIIGSLFGELFYQMEMKIVENNGKLMGSKKLGSVTQFLLNPGYHLSMGINNIFASRVIVNSETDLVTRQEPLDPFNPELGSSNFIGLQMRFRFW